MHLTGWSWGLFVARWILGLLFGMAGFWKVFEMGATEHARRFFLEGYTDSWIPVWLLWTLGVTIPFVELAAGALLCLGLRVREAAVALGLVLIVVTYGHLLAEPLFDVSGHIFTRTALLLFVLAAPAAEDRLALDALFRGKRGNRAPKAGRGRGDG